MGNYKAGDCLLWDQSISKSATRQVKKVACDQPHLFEYVKSLHLRNERPDYPSEERWEQIFEEYCTRPINEYLGYELDKHGKFAVGALHPTSKSWAVADRTLHCGIQSKATTQLENDELVEFMGAVKGQSQLFLYPTGACVDSDNSKGIVDCAQPHTFEIAGNTEVKSASLPRTDAEWHRAISGCDSVVRAYLGHSVRGGFGQGYLPIPESSWRAGQRTVQCTLSRSNNSKAIGSARDY